MAHKHNRRRTRPRSRHNKTLSHDSDLFATPAYPFDSSSLGLSIPSLPRPKTAIPPPHVLSHNISTRHWHNRYVAWQNRESAQQREAAKIEAEQLKIFGGEPGDDDGLCLKMMEVFEGMAWVDAVE